jgi:hypothetical protein
LPAADAQNADLEHPEVEQQNRVNIRQNIVSQFKDPKTGAWTPEVAQSAPPIPVHPSQIPEYAAANPAGKRAIETQYIDGRKAYDAWQKSVTDEMNRQATAADKNYTDGLNARRQASTQAHSDTAADTRSQRQIDAAATLEANRQKDATTKENDARTWDLTKPRDPKEVSAAFSTVPNETGVVSGKDPTTYMAEAMGYVKKDASGATVPDADLLSKTFSPDEQATIGQAMVNGYHFSPGTTAPMITKAITAAMTDPKYTMVPTRISPDKTYGVPRVSVTVTHQGAHTGVTFVLPEDDYKNLQGLYQDRQAAATNKPTAPIVTAPTPHAPAFPGTTPGGAPSSAFGVTPQVITPNQQWWLDQATGRGRAAIPAFPTPTPGQNQRGLVH